MPFDHRRTEGRGATGQSRPFRSASGSWFFFNYNDGKLETTEGRKEGREFTVGSVIHDWEQEESAMTDEAKLRLCILNGPLAFLTESECK